MTKLLLVTNIFIMEKLKTDIDNTYHTINMPIVKYSGSVLLV